MATDVAQSEQTPSGGSPGGQGGPPVIEKVRMNPAGQMVVHVRGREAPIVDARVARCFPWSLPDRYVSLRDADGKEIVLLNSLENLDGESRQVVERELKDKVFNPQIRRITKYQHEYGVTSVTAETDRGIVTFQIRSRDDVRILSSTRLLFRDADGNTYELPDLNALDLQARKWLQEHF